jgi:multidrug efflux system membrane fusion protein
MVDTHQEFVGGNDPAYAREAPGRTRPSRVKLAVRLAVMAVLLAIVFGGFYAWDRMRSAQMAQIFAGMKPPPMPVAVAEAVSVELPRRLSGIGSLWSVHQVSVAPELGGRVTKIFFEAGAAVKAGDPLIQLNDEPEQGDLANYRAQARLAQINLTRAKELAARQAGPVSNVDTYQSQLDQANAWIARTQAVIAQKLVRGPFDGVLGIRQVDLGQYVNAGTMVVTLTNLDTLYVNFTLPEQNRANLAVGQSIEIGVDAYPGRSFVAKLTTIEPQVSADTRNIKLQATLANPEHLLLPGMFANARVVLPSQTGVVVVPETAVDFTLYGDSVFLVTQDGEDAAGKPVFKVRRTQVKPGEHFGGKVAILDGLKPGDSVATSGQNKLNDGAVVVPGTSDSLATPANMPNS